MDTPLISILMGVYYQKEDTTLLRRSVDSILQQSFDDFEFLICDDGSSPAAKSYLDRVAAADTRIRLIREGGLFPLPQKLNACLRQAKGSYIARMDDDDFSHPTRFETQLAFLSQNPHIAFVGSDVNLWRDEILAQRCFPALPTVRDFYFTQPFVHPTLMFRTECLLAVDGYSEEKHALLCEDYDLLLRLYHAGYQGANINTCLLDYSIPEKNSNKRKMRHRWNEAVTRYRRFKQLGQFPQALPYVIKPLAVGLLPPAVLQAIKGERS